MKKRPFLFISSSISFLGILVLGACGDETTTVGPASTLVIAPRSNPGQSSAVNYSDKEAEEMRQHFKSVMDEARRRWQAKVINNYQIITSFKGDYYDETKVITITVKNNEISTNTAVATPTFFYKGPSKKPGPYKAVDYTIPGLFDTLGSLVYVFDPQKNVFNVSFDPTYAFPSKMIFDYKDITDSRHETKVISFQVLQ